MSAPLIKIPLKDIELITNNFADASFIGEGFLGKIYEGQLSLSGDQSIDVAVRRLDNSLRLQEILFEKEISILTRLRHENMVSVVGFCYENDEMLIVSKRVARGSLSRHLSDPKLTWIRRLQISVGAVRALSYLHSFSIIHHNINTDSILIDENWEAKISGFEYSMTIPTGSLDRAYNKFRIGSCKSDMFSIGVVLFELLCRKEALFSEDNKKSFQASTAIFHYENRTLNTLVDPDLFSQMDPVSFNIFSKIAYNCLIDQRDPPTMDQVLQRLERALKFQQLHENNGQYSTVAVERTIPDHLKLKGHYSTVAVERTIPDHLKLKLKSLEHMRIRLDDILTATENFAAKYGIVSGGFGLVYKSELDHVDKAYCFAIERENKHELPKKRSTVAIKRIMDTEDEIAEQGFYAEIEMLTSCKHSNILTLLGFCDEGGKLILIYEYASNRSLSDYLQKMSKIHNDSWAQRVKICLDVAKGLSCLHTTDGDRQEIVHRDIKSSNILLDENFEAKVGDFGLSVLLSDSQDTKYSRTSVGTPGYVDPQYWEDAKLKKESDVYSFGVVLFEILCGTLAYDRKYTNNKGLAHVARQHFNKGSIMEMVDPKIKEEIAGTLFTSIKASSQKSLDTFSKIAYKCLAEKQVERPTMEVVVKKLEKALFLKESNKDNLQMSFEEIKLATQNFKPENFIGRRGYANAYRGSITRDNEITTVVVKRLERSYGHGAHEFFKELVTLFDYKHENIVGLEGYVNKNGEKIIVYEHASKQNLRKYLNDVSLTWTKRLKICIDIVSGLAFLHGGGPTKEMVIHRDINSVNILLYGDWKAKISDFGLAAINRKEGREPVAGPIEYRDPLFKTTAFLTEKSDIYSLGVVLFEILCGQSLPRLTRDYDDYKGVTRILEQIHEEEKVGSIVFKDIKEQMAPKSLSTFRAIVIQCLVHDRQKRPTAKEVLQRLEKSLELQEDYEIWTPKLPEDYEKILKLSTYSETYSTKMKKDLYNLLSKGILLQDDKMWFSLGSNGERNEIISARTFSYRNGSPHDNWCIVPESRFEKVAEILDISNLMIEIETKTPFLSPNTVYGVYLVFKFCDSRNVSRNPVYVDLKYRSESETLHAYFATWRKDEWMMIELYRFLNHKDADHDFKFLLESLSPYYCRDHDAIYIEGIEFRPIDNAGHEETEKSKEIQQVLKSNLKLEQVPQMPTKSEMILKGSINYDYGEELFSLTQVNRKKHLMLSAKAALSDLASFNSKPSPESRFEEVLELLPQQTFRISCMIKSQMLSQDTEYVCYLVFKLSEKCHDLHGPVEVRDLLQKNKVAEIVYLRTPSPWNIHNITRVPKQRTDGWMEVNIWKFNSNHELENDCVRVNLKLLSYEGSMFGLIVCGLEFRPM